MKKVILLIAFAIGMVGCGIETINKLTSDYLIVGVTTYDSCEYIIYAQEGYYNGLTHKGNCKNPIHAENK